MTAYSHCKPAILLKAVSNDKQSFVELAEIFLQESLRKYSRLEYAALNSEWKTLQIESHTLKSMAAQLGAERLMYMLEAIEIGCGANQPVFTVDYLGLLNQELHETRQELKHFMTQYVAG